jgi:hypothetical protein
MPQTSPLTNAAPLVKWFQCPAEAIREVITGLCHAGGVRGYLDKTECDRQADAILNGGYDARSDGVPGGTLGPSLFQHANDPIQYFYNSALAASRVQGVLGTTHPPHLVKAIEAFEALGYGFRIRPMVYRGLPSAYNRALIFKSDQPVVVPIHEDVANVRALSSHGLEISGTDIILAHNLYLRNRPGEGSLYMYGKRFSHQEKLDLDRRIGNNSKIAETGYPYPESEFSHIPTTVLDVNAGDYVVFRADYPHKVANTSHFTNGWRVSWNGFFTCLSSADPYQLVYWT